LATTIQRAIASGQASAAIGLEVCEFVNGREVRPRNDPGPTLTVVQRFSEAISQVQPAMAVAFLESDEAIDLIFQSSGMSAPTVARLPMPTENVRIVQGSFDDKIRYALLKATQRAAADTIAEILDEIGLLVAGHVQPGTHICFLPSQSLLGLPLHAATCEGRLLLEDHSISYGPNLAMVTELLTHGPLAAPAAGSAGLVLVPRAGERPELVERGTAVADRLAKALFSASGAPIVDLRDTAADKASCLAAFTEVDHLIVLVHGVASRLQGRGLCVSDGRALPRAPLPIDTAPQLARFVIDAGDLAVLPNTPTTMVSLACSSGQTTAGAGGSRIGLDRGLFPNGTRTVVAPLWDVNQESAIALIEDFHRRWVDEPDVGPAVHLQHAQLAAHQHNDALYHWAPLVMKGNWL
jgi:hypothetical protein